jgi:hypothetical protein
MHAAALRDIRDWCRRDDKAIGIILSLLSDAEKQSINQDAQTSKDLWDEITARHKDENTGIAAFFIRRSIIAKRYDPDEPAPPGMTAMSVHASFYSKENKKLGPKGFEDEFLAQLLLFSLPRELNWESLSISLLRDVTETKPLVFAAVLAAVCAEATRVDGINGHESYSGDSKALAATSHSSNKSKSKSKLKPSSSSSSFSSSSTNCDYCDRPGHIIDNCRLLKEDDAKDRKRAELRKRIKGKANLASTSDAEFSDSEIAHLTLSRDELHVF